MEKRNYTVTLQLTEEEARTLLDTAAKREQGIGEFLSEIVSYIHSGRGDEGDLLEDYLQRSEPVGAERSFVNFCLYSGYDPGYLESLTDDIADHDKEAALIREEIEKDYFPIDRGWLPKTTKEDAYRELDFQESVAGDCKQERWILLHDYQRMASTYGGTPKTEEECMKEAREYKEKLETWMTDGRA